MVRETEATTSPRVPASQGLPLPVDPPRFFPAELFSIGAHSAHDTRCAGLGNPVTSTPISAISS